MIGGYIHRDVDLELVSRMQNCLDDSQSTIAAWDHGFLFHDEPFGEGHTRRLISDDIIAVSQDHLVTTGSDGEYRTFDLSSELAPLFARDEAAAFDRIASDFRMAIVQRRDGETTLFLVSHRAGSGRLYYHKTPHGVVFSSDLRFLLRVVPCEVSHVGIYAILKYGAVPDPLTISSNVSSVPAAHFLKYDVQGHVQDCIPYFKLRFECERETGEPRSDSEILDPVRDTLRKSSRFLGTDRPAILLSGGIDSSLYGCYLAEAGKEAPVGFYCVFGDDDPELEFATAIANRIGAELSIARMEKRDALDVLNDVTRLTDHPFSDFSSLPIVFTLKHVREHVGEGATLVECNGGDDCFGFPDLGGERKARLKHGTPRVLKNALAGALGRLPHWKWESHEGTLARWSALADAHESTPFDYFLVLTPVGYLGLRTSPEWDEALASTMGSVFADFGEDHDRLSFRAKTTIRQLIHVNGRRWAAKALSVGESLGLRVVYPYIWREVLEEQGRIPWDAKTRDGIVKWPLKRLLEDHMPTSFIYRKKSGFVPPFATWLTHDDFNRRAREILLDRNAVVTEVVPRDRLQELLSDAAAGRKLRHSILNLLWGALFTEMWIREHGGR